MITRREWSRRFRFCFYCGCTAALETHEIVRGAFRQRGVKQPCTWIRTCGAFGNNCHADKFDGMSIAVQLAFKLKHDKEHYDLERVNVLRSRQPDAITDADVAEAMRTLTDKE